MGYHSDDLVSRACLFAARMHYRQRRANRGRDPYIFHLAEVAELVRASGGNDLEIAASWLHDVVEDTRATIKDLESRFGTVISDMVDGLTDPPEFEGLPVLARKMKQAERILTKSDSVKRIKIADQISDIRLIAVDPPLRWDREKCFDYTIGAKFIVNNCGGVSELLEAEFYEAYKKALEVYR